jgi:hypothetical protein
MGGAITGKFITTHQDRVITATFGGFAPGLASTALIDLEELASSLEARHLRASDHSASATERAETVRRGDRSAVEDELGTERSAGGRGARPQRTESQQR